LIVKHLVETAHREKATMVAHGCSAKGNDQVRFEVGIRSLDPRLKVIAPLKEWEIRSREEAIEYVKEQGIQIRATKKKPYSIDKNLWGVSIEAGILENPWQEPPEDAFLLTRNTRRPGGSTTLTIEFKKGVPIRLNGTPLGLVSLIERVGAIGARYGIGRVDMIENRVVGIKSREVYEAPAATLLIQAHEEIESLVFDREFLHYKRLLSEKYAELVYYGLWFSPLREALDVFFARHQERVNGVVKFRMTAGQARVIGRKSPESLYSESLATYSEKDRFDRNAAEGFIKLWGLPYEKIVGK
jgi:argininosuccinate synthase